MSNLKQRFGTIPFGAVAATLIFVYTLQSNLWGKIDEIAQVLLAIALVLTFFLNFNYRGKTVVEANAKS